MGGYGRVEELGGGRAGERGALLVGCRKKVLHAASLGAHGTCFWVWGSASPDAPASMQCLNS
eukprot:350172-Chlamydomonas_euryale.AAC.6